MASVHSAATTNQPADGPVAPVRHGLSGLLREAGLALGRSLARERSVVLALFAWALLGRVTIALVVPPWQGPDEPKHFEYVALLVDKRDQLWAERRLLDVGDASFALQDLIISTMIEHDYWRYLGRATPQPRPQSFAEIWPGGTHTQLHRPSLYYYLLAPGLLPFQGADLASQLRLARVLSAFLSALVVPITYLAARKLAPGDRFVPTVGAAFAAALPMHAFVGGVVNTDNLVTLGGALVALALARGLRRGFGLGGWALVLGSLVLALAAKRTALGLVPPVLVAGLVWLASLRGRRLLLAVRGLGVALVGAAIAWALPPLAGVRSALTAYALNAPDQVAILGRVELGSPETQALIGWHLRWLFWSFWGIFGWFSVPIEPGLYRALMAASLVCGLGLVVWLGSLCVATIRRSSGSERSPLPLATVYVTALVAMVALAEAERLAIPSPSGFPQGRYLFVALTPIATLYACGARALLPRRVLGTRLPALVCVGALLALDVAVFVESIGPAYLAPGF